MIRQKEVDVLLAVEMLSHAFQKNMQEVALLAGDLDFRPAIEALVQLGIRVHLVFDPSHCTPELIESADVRLELGIKNYFAWSSYEFRNSRSPPTHSVVRLKEDHGYRHESLGALPALREQFEHHSSVYIQRVDGLWDRYGYKRRDEEWVLRKYIPLKHKK